MTTSFTPIPTPETETWFIFDMKSEGFDPRFVEWLEYHGITVKLNESGRSPGVIANLTWNLPQQPPSDWLIKEMPPVPSVEVKIGERLPNLQQIVQEFDASHPPQERIEINPFNSNYGRTPEREASAKYMLECLSNISQILNKLEHLNELVFRSELSEEIDTIISKFENISSKITPDQSDRP